MEDNELHIACFDSRPVRAIFRYAALLVGSLATGVAFCVDLFAAYGETLKETFGFTQKECKNLRRGGSVLDTPKYGFKCTLEPTILD